MEVKRILIVDDHFDTLKFLRSLLELADSRYEVIAVRSGEEAGLELRRHFDLAIVDLRLPGIDGIEVARRAKKRAPDMPVILVSGFPKELSRVEALDVDIYCYFRKPLEADAMLAAVHVALWGEPLPQAAEIIQETIVEEVVEELVVETKVTPEIVDRLEQLRQNTGAEQLLLGTITGQVAAKAGILDLNLPLLCQTLAENLRQTFTLADQLGTTTGHQTIQYQTSNLYDVYTANVGEYHFITMFFDARAKRGRIGTVWVFVQRATKDLEPLLANARVQRVEKTVKKKLTTTTTQPSAAQEIVAKLVEEMPRAPVQTEVPARPTAVSTPAPTPPAPAPTAEIASYEPPPALELEPVRDEDFQKLAAFLSADDNTPVPDNLFELPATAESETALLGGVTLAEAMQQGLIDTLSPDTNATLAAVMAEEAANGLATADNLAALLQAAEAPAPAFTLDLGPVEDELDLSDLPHQTAAPTLDLQAAADAADIDLSNMPGLPTSDPAPAEAATEITLDWGDLGDDDDFDLTGMPGLPGTAAAPSTKPAKAPKETAPAPTPPAPTTADQPLLELIPADDDEFDLTGMPGLPTSAAPAPAAKPAKASKATKPAPTPPPAGDDDEFDLTGMPGLDEPAEKSAATSPAVQAEIDAFWNALVSGDTGKGVSTTGKTLDEALVEGIAHDDALSSAAEGGLGELAGLDDAAEAEADAFWDAAVSETASASLMKGMTLEEAQKQGLIPTDLGSG